MKSIRELLCSPLVSFLWLIYAIIVFYTDEGKTFGDHNRLLMSIYLTYFMCLYTWVSKGNRVFSLFVFFVVFSLFYNTGQSFIYALSEDSTLLYVYNNYTIADVCYMLKFQLLCISGFFLGESLCLRKQKNNISHNELVAFYQQKKIYYSSRDNRLFILFQVCAFVVFLFTIYQLLLRQTMSYSDLYENRETVSPYFSFGAILIGLYFIYQKKHTKLILIFYVWCVLAYTMAGTRSMAIAYVGALWLVTPMVYPKYFKKKYYPILLVVALLGVASISIVSQMRTNELGSGASLDTGEMGPIVASIREMGISQVPTMITIEHFSEQGYSQTILYFLCLSICPSFILNEITPESWQLRIGSWATDVSNTTFTQWGSSWIAEAYINYGEFGWIFMLIYGYIIAYAENVALRRITRGKYLIALCALICLCKQLFYARAEICLLTDYFKPCMYIGIIWLLFHKRNIKAYENSNISRGVRNSYLRRVSVQAKTND